MELKFKGSPWPWQRCSHTMQVRDSTGSVVCNCPVTRGVSTVMETETNVRLIAAAPELLEVCVKLCAFCTEVATMSQIGDKSGVEEVGIKIGNLYGDAYKAIMKALEE